MPTAHCLLPILLAVLCAGGCMRDRERPAEPETTNWHHPTSVAEAQGKGIAAPAEEPAPASDWYRPRSSWTTQPVLTARATPMGGTPVRITVHHSDFPGDTGPDTPAVLRRIETAHLRGIGRDGQPGACIAYHFLIGPDGTVYEGRPLRFQGAHAGGDNNIRNIGVCLLGNFEIHHVPAAQARSLVAVLDRLRRTYGIPRSRVLGHLDFNPPGSHHTDCPGIYLYQLVRNYRSEP